MSSISILPQHLIRHLNRIKYGNFAIRNFYINPQRKSSTTSTRQQELCKQGIKHIMEIGCKIAIVNGGTSGIGLAAASQLLAAGARNVAVTGDNVCKGKEAATFLNQTYGMGKAIYINCNVNCMSQFEDAFKMAHETYKRIDIVVNAVGICDGAQWEREIVTNIVGTIRGTLLAYRYVGKEGCGTGGTVINIAGISGMDALPPAPTLSASLHAIVGLSKSFGHQLHTEKSGIRVVCLCPGFTSTDFLKNIGSRGMSDSLGMEFENFLKKTEKQKPDPCGHAVVHLIKYAENGSIWVCEGNRLLP